MNDDVEDESEPLAPQRYEYEEPSLIDLEDLEGVTGGGAEIWPKTDWNDEF